MAGLAETCSHVGAVLHWVETAVRIRDSTTCTSKDNIWLMPVPTRNIPYLQLGESDFSVPKCNKLDTTPPSHAPVRKSVAPSQIQMEKDDFLRQIASDKKPILLKPNGENFVQLSDHVPQLLCDIFTPTYLEYTYTQLLTPPTNFTQVKATPSMVNHLA